MNWLRLISSLPGPKANRAPAPFKRSKTPASSNTSATLRTWVRALTWTKLRCSCCARLATWSHGPWAQPGTESRSHDSGVAQRKPQHDRSDDPHGPGQCDECRDSDHQHGMAIHQIEPGRLGLKLRCGWN